MPAIGQTNTAPGLALPMIGDSGIDTNGNALPGDQGIDLEQGEFDYYAVAVPTNNAALLRTVLQAISGDPNLYLRAGAVPTLAHYSGGSYDVGTSWRTPLYDRSLTGDATEYANWVPLDGRYETQLTNGLWVIAVQAGGNGNARYRLQLSCGNSVTNGIVQDLALNGGGYANQNLNGGDWRYYRVQIPDPAPANWTVSWSRSLGSARMFVRDTSPPGDGQNPSPANYANPSYNPGPWYSWQNQDLETWASDGKNEGPYPRFDSPGTCTLSTPPLRPGSVYYLGFWSPNDTTFSVSSSTSGPPVLVTNTIAFNGGSFTRVLPGYGSLSYRMDVPPGATRILFGASNSVNVVLSLEQGTMAQAGGPAHWTSYLYNNPQYGNQANASLNQSLASPNNWPWLPGYSYYLTVTNTSAAPENFNLTMSLSADLSPVSFIAPVSVISTRPNPAIQVVWGVTNQGLATASGGWSDRVWFSTNGVLDGQSRSLGDFYISQPVAPGGTYRQTNNVTLPMSASGNYWLFVQVDVNNSIFEASLGDKVSAPVAGTFTSTPVDLVAVAVSAATNVYSIRPNPAIQVAWGVTNQGTATASGGWYDRVWFSTNDVLDGQSRSLGDFYVGQAVAPGSGYGQTNTVTLPMSASGNYWLFVQVDVNNVLFQINPNDKISAPVAGTFTATPVDLSPVTLWAPTNAISTGANPAMQVVWAVTNRGTATASGGWYDRVWFSTNGILDGQSRSLGDNYIGQTVAPGAIYWQTNNVTLPMNTNGNYWLFVQADINNSMFEARLDDKISAPVAGTLTLLGTNGVLSNGSFTWSGNIPSGSAVTVAANGVLVFSGNVTISGGVTNAGMVRLASGNLQLSGCSGGAPQLVNLPGALVDIQADVSIDQSCSDAAFLNLGTVRKSGGLGTSTINPGFNNYGLLDVQTGTISLNNGGSGNGVFAAQPGATLKFASSYTANSGSLFTGDGTNLLSSGTFTLNGLVSGSHAVLAGASLAGTNGVIAGVMTWTSGWIASGSTLTVATNGVLLLAGNNGNDYYLYGALTNAGTIRLVSGNLELCCSPGYLLNLPSALVDLAGDTSVDRGCGSELLVNLGTVRKSGGTGASTIYPVFNNFGLLDVQSGTLNLSGGGSGGSGAVFQAEVGATLRVPNSYAANSGSQFTGVGTNLFSAGTFTLNGLVNGSNAVLAGAALAGTNGVIAGVMTWTSGSIATGSTLTIATNGLLVLVGNNGSDYYLQGALTNAGTIRLVSGNLELYCSPGYLLNLPGALVDLAGDTSVDRGCGSELFDNLGTVRKSAGTGASTINSVFSNFGLLEVQTGTVNLSGGGSGGSGAVFHAEVGATLRIPNNYAANSGSQFTGVGTNLFSAGTFTLNGLVNGSNAVLAGAALAGTNGVIAGVMTWTSGSIATGSTLTIATNGLLLLAGKNGSDYYLQGALTNAGTIRLVSGNLELYCSPGYLLNLPGAMVDLAGDVSFDRGCGTELFVNLGTVRKSGGTGTSAINPVFNNLGLLDVQSGIVNLNGNYTLAGGALNFGLTSLTNFGRIRLSGSPAVLAGTLGANLNNGYLPNVGAAFPLLSYSSASGVFANLNLPGGTAWQTNYGSTVFTLSRSSGPPTLGFGSTPAWGTNGFRFAVDGQIGQAYILQASTNLVNWVPILNFTCTNSPTYVADPAAKNFIWRFYRVAQ
jgi:hypothetical protein